MSGIATRTQVYVGYYGDGTTHWNLSPALDGHNYILICDRTRLTSLPTLEQEPDWSVLGIVVETRVPHAVEVFASNADGGFAGDSMTALRELISLRRHSEGIDLADILTRLGYSEAPNPEQGENA